MRMHCANITQSLRLICSSVQTRANFSSSVLTHDSPRGTAALSSIKTFQTFDSPWKPPTDTHPPKRVSSTLASIAEQPDNGSQRSTSTIRSSQPIGISEAHHTFPSQHDEKPVSGNSSALQHSVGISTRNEFRTRHGSLGSTARLKIRMTPSFSSDEPSKNRTQMAAIVIKPPNLPEVSELGCFYGKIHLASYAIQKRGNGVRIRRRPTRSGTLDRTNQGQEFVHQMGNHAQEKDISLMNTEVSNSGDCVRIKLAFDPLNALGKSNHGSELVHQDGKSLSLINTGFVDYNGKNQGSSVKTPQRHSELFCSESNRKKKPNVGLVQARIYQGEGPNKNSRCCPGHLESTAGMVEEIPANNEKTSVISHYLGPQPESSYYWHHFKPTASRREEESDMEMKPVIHRPIGPDEESSDHLIHPESRGLSSLISPVPKLVLWTPLQPSSSVYLASEGDEKPDLEKMQSAIDQPRGSDGESSDYTKHRDLKTVQSLIQPVRRVFSWKPCWALHSFYPADGDEKIAYVDKMQSIKSRPGPANVSFCPYLRLDLRTIQHSDGDNSTDAPDKFLLTWKIRYAIIVRGMWNLRPLKGFSNVNWQSLITPDMDGKAILEACSKISDKEPVVIWREFMLWALRHNPERALKVLDLTISERLFYIPRYALVDCLAYLAAFYLQGRLKGRLERRLKRDPRRSKPRDLSKYDQILRLTCTLIQDPQFREGREPAFFDGGTLDLVVGHGKGHNVRTLWDIFLTHDVKLRRCTLYLFVRKFEQWGDRVRAIDVLLKLYQKSLRMSAIQIEKKVLGYLYVRPDGENWFEIQAQVWDRLLRSGMRLTLKMYTAMVKSCMEADQCDAALIVYRQARDRNLVPRANMYIYLLDGVERGWGSDVLDLVIRDADTDGVLRACHNVVYKILLAKSGLDFPELLEFYGRYYNFAPLYTFGIIQRGQLLPKPSVWSRQPSARALGAMLHHVINQHPTSPEVLGLYNNYHALLREGNFYARRLAVFDYVSNSFIWAFGKRPETLNLCTIVLRAMLIPHPYAKIQQPTVVSWTLLLQSFCRHKQMVAAEKVLTMMRDRGVEPDENTWSALILGYSAAQDIDGAMSAVKRMEAAGLPLNNRVVEGLAVYRDREKMLELLDDAIKADSHLQTDKMGE